ncbi:hypothetical protein COBT_003757, partial [Conglomerata obtusa]
MCIDNKIQHQKVAVEAHNSNGRVERVIRTIREGIMKAEGKTLFERCKITTKAYNMSYHDAIKMTPMEAIKETKDVLEIVNSKYSAYASKFKEKVKTKYRISQKVLVCKRENLNGNQTKESMGRFEEKGTVMNIFPND